MSDPAQELMELSMETRQLSAYIGKLKDDKTMVTDEADRNRLAEEIKMRQFQVLFYMEKIMVPPFLIRASPVNVVANIYQADDKG
jgi:hypothetical protein